MICATCIRNIFLFLNFVLTQAELAQSLEHETVNGNIAGSIPMEGDIFLSILLTEIFLF